MPSCELLGFLSSSSPFVEKTFFAAHAEHGLGHGASVIGEFGQFLEKTVSSGNEITGRYFQIQGTLRPFRGFYLYQTFEYVNDDGVIS